jgi:prepilin-type processing-associated H-X9-DG protein/prepilin-type N-terminal cleavage/methylation domain-containing protein
MRARGRLSKAFAFTLLELLVVIAVIGVLAALLLTGLGAAKERGGEAQCINNVHQLGIALQGFVTEYHVYPPAFVPISRRAEHPEYGESWEYALEAAELTGRSVPLDGHYDVNENPGPAEWIGKEEGRPIELKNSWKGVWHCPCALPPPANFPAQVEGQSYGYNANGLAGFNAELPLGLGGLTRLRPGKNSSFQPIPASDVISPSDMMAIGDRFVGNRGVVSETTGLARVPGGSETPPNGYFGSTKHAFARHDGKANVVFCDGHVESPSFKTLFDETTDVALRRWNRDHEPHPDLLAR